MISIVLLSLILLGCQNKQNPGLRQGKFNAEAQGKSELKKLESLYSNKAEWETCKFLLRENILTGRIYS